MKIKIFLTLIWILLNCYSFSQTTDRKLSFIKYIDENYGKLDPIEGLWIFNVEKWLEFPSGSTSEKEVDLNRSEWGIKKISSYAYSLIDVSEGTKQDKIANWEVIIEKTSVPGYYTYKMITYSPYNCTEKASFFLDENSNFFSYDLYTCDEEMKRRKNYYPGLMQNNSITWIKKYPTEVHESTSNEWSASGSGFFIDKNGYIATNYHVIEDASEIEVDFIQNNEKKSFKAKVISSDKQNDLAIIKIDDAKFKPYLKLPYSIKTIIKDVGSNVFTLGYPMALTLMGEEVKFTDGKISSKTGFQGDITTYQISVPVQPGNSGGPLFDYDGNIIGVVNAKIMAADNVSYAIKLTYLKNLIDVIPDKLILPNDITISQKTLTDKIKILSNYVVLIKIR
jgi:S1-C subfamily serine protease